MADEVKMEPIFSKSLQVPFPLVPYISAYPWFCVWKVKREQRAVLIKHQKQPDFKRLPPPPPPHSHTYTLSVCLPVCLSVSCSLGPPTSVPPVSQVQFVSSLPHLCVCLSLSDLVKTKTTKSTNSFMLHMYMNDAL